MNRTSLTLVVLTLGLLPIRTMAAEVWKGAWKSALAGSDKSITVTLTRTEQGIAGTVEIDGETLIVTGTSDGAWREVVWRDPAGRVTQFRGVASGRTWSGLTLAGGGGQLVEYGRVRMTRAPETRSAADGSRSGG